MQNKNVGQGNPVDDADGYLTDDASANYFFRKPFGERKEVKEGD
jgi:hypothetical protein